MNKTDRFKPISVHFCKNSIFFIIGKLNKPIALSFSAKQI